MTPGASTVLEGYPRGLQARGGVLQYVRLDFCLLVDGRSRSLGYYPAPTLRKPNGPVIGFVAVDFN